MELLEPLVEPEGARVLVTPFPPNGQVDLMERGIGPAQADGLRSRLAAFIEDWDRPEMNEYDALPPR